MLLGAPTVVRTNDDEGTSMHMVTIDDAGRLTIGTQLSAAPPDYRRAAPSAPAKGTPPCDGWGCTCQGLSDKFGTVVGAWHHAKQVPTAKRFWEARKCHTFPGGTGKPPPPGSATTTSMPLKPGEEVDPAAAQQALNQAQEARNRFKEREFHFQAQRERLEAEAAKERQLLATMIKNRDRAASDGPTGDSGALVPQRPRTGGGPGAGLKLRTMIRKPLKNN